MLIRTVPDGAELVGGLMLTAMFLGGAVAILYGIIAGPAAVVRYLVAKRKLGVPPNMRPLGKRDLDGAFMAEG